MIEVPKELSDEEYLELQKKQEKAAWVARGWTSVFVEDDEDRSEESKEDLNG